MDELIKILDASEQLFRKYGIRSVTMTDIAQKMGMSKKTLYVYVSNKHDLVSKIMKRYVDENRSVCLEIQRTAENALDELLKVSLYVQRQVKEINPSLLFDLQKYHYPIWEMLDAFHKKDVLEMVEMNLNRGVKEGLYRSDLQVPIVARVHVGLMPILSNSDLFPMQSFPTHTLHKEFIKYHIHGIVSKEGREFLIKALNNLDPKGDIH